MMQRANYVVRLLEDLRRQVHPDGERKPSPTAIRDDHRPPKRPWEDMAQESVATEPESASYSEVLLSLLPQSPNSLVFQSYKPHSMSTNPRPTSGQLPPSNHQDDHPAIQPQVEQPPQSQSAVITPSEAEQDMELIRSKRAATTSGSVNGSPGQTKNKYRKRSVSRVSFASLLTRLILVPRLLSGQRANPPGKCHSCNIRETPEWRRGPDGARTLCNACGLRMLLYSWYLVPCSPRYRLCQTHSKAGETPWAQRTWH